MLPSPYKFKGINMLQKFTPQIYLFFLTFTFFSCKHSSTLPDVSLIDVDVKIERFDQELATLDSAKILEQNKAWSEQYGAFYADFMQYMLEAGNPSDTLHIKKTLSEMLRQRDFKALATAVEKKYPTLKNQENDLTQAFKYVKYYFPEYNLPRFVAYFSGFSVQTPIGDGYIGIGLDMFLGADSEFYPALVGSIPLYLSRRFTPENITPRVVESVLRQELYPQENTDLNTLQHMVYQGKILLALDSILPDMADSLKIGYTAHQMKWANTYQSEIWAWFLQEELLYNTDYLHIQKYFTEAPFTPELGENNASAPKLGTYLGWMMVRKYMQQNPHVTLRQLLANNNAQDILEKSKFKGK